MRDIEELYQEFHKELRIACRSFYTWKNIQNIAKEDKNILSALYENPLSWDIILHSLQSTFFITISRLFDKDGRAFSVHTLLRTCIENIDQFSKYALRERRIKSSNTDKLSWLDKYIEDSYQPNKEDFLKLKGEVSKKQKLYDSGCKPIRDKIFAHKELEGIKKVDELFRKVMIDKTQDILCFLYQIEMIIFEILYNGRLMNVGHFPFNEEEFIMKDIMGLLNKIKS